MNPQFLSVLLVGLPAVHAADMKPCSDKPPERWEQKSLAIVNGERGAMLFAKADAEPMAGGLPSVEKPAISPVERDRDGKVRQAPPLPCTRQGPAEFRPGQEWKDEEGTPIQAHGGGILADHGRYYWYGENKSLGGGNNRLGVSCYSSDNLYDWKCEGLALPKEAMPPEFREGGIVERPKVIYNPATHQYVMWMHLDGNGYRVASAGVATSDKPTGPFVFQSQLRLVHEDLGFKDDDPTLQKSRGATFRDMNLFLDDDGKAYVFYASEGNATMHVVRLNSGFTGPEMPMVAGKTWARIFAGDFREAPAPFKWNGRYYLITSGCSGWNSNAAMYAVADNILGPWTMRGNPCVGEGADKTFESQSTFVLPVPERPGCFVFMADRWNPSRLQDSSYVWLPFVVKPDGTFELRWHERWSLSDLTRNSAPARPEPSRSAGQITASDHPAPPAVTGGDREHHADGKAEPFDPRDVRLLDGPFKTIQELHRTGLVGQLDPDRLLFNFRSHAGLPQPNPSVKSYGGWDDGFVRGHYAGHYLSAAARMYAATGDVSFRDKADHMVKVLAECQEKLGGGYLSAFGEGAFDGLETQPHKASVPYYTIHKILAGLVDVARFCDNRQALDVAAGMSDYFARRMAKLTSDQIETMLRTDYTGNPVNEFGGMAEALADLYDLARKSGDPLAERHLRLAAVFNRPWIIDPLCQGEDKLNGIHGNTHAAQAAGWARYALATGDKKTARAAGEFWKRVVNEHSFVNGGNSFHEKLRAAKTEVAGTGPAALNLLTSESCNTHNMLKIARSLFELNPAPAYGDYCEHALFNHILSTIAPDDGSMIYYMPLRPGGFRIYLDGPYCCQGTGIENAARFNEAIYFHKADTLWVNLFIASTLDWREQGLKLRMETRYPETGAIRMSFEVAQPVQATVNLRIPAWVDGPVGLTINGEKQPGDFQPGTFAAVARRWQNGDILELALPLSLRVRPAMDDPNTVSFFRGPVLLAGELGRAGMPASERGGNMAHSSEAPWPAPVFVNSSPGQERLPVTAVPTSPLAFEAHVFNPVDGKEETVRLSPFYQVQHQRFAVYWKVLIPAQFEAYRKRFERQRAEQTFIGKAEEEADRHLQSEKSSSGTWKERQYRDADVGGWFSYRLALPSESGFQLACTYWGGETIRRTFDVLIDDVKIATQTLEQNKPGEFFDVSYQIPNELVKGKQFVTVRFQPQPGSKAGGVFDVRFHMANPPPAKP